MDWAVRVHPNLDTIVSGGAKGADTMGENYAKILGLKTVIYKPDWSKKGGAFLRNTDIVNDSDLVMAFWDGKSNGTKDSIDKARRFGKKLIICRKSLPLFGRIDKNKSTNPTPQVPYRTTQASLSKSEEP